MRVIRRPERMDAVSRPAIRGSISRPEPVGEAASTTCRKSGRKVSAPNLARPTRNEAPVSTPKGTEDRLRADPRTGGAEPLERAEEHERGHRLRRARQGRAGEKDDDRELEPALAAVHVAELSVERRGDRGGEQVARDHPREVAH